MKTGSVFPLQVFANTVLGVLLRIVYQRFVTVTDLVEIFPWHIRCLLEPYIARMKLY
jgi:hypothetical protein